MKMIFVVGFYDPVKRLLDDNFAERLAEGSVIWISGRKGCSADVEKFKSSLFDALVSRAPTEVLVLYAVPADQTWLVPQVERLIGQARQRFQHTPIALDCFEDAAELIRTSARISGFGLSARQGISMADVERKLNGSKVICVSALGFTTVKDALLRAGIESQAVCSLFDEDIVPTGKNSMLNDRLIRHASSYSYIIYAWDGLRTSSSGVVQAFKKKGKFFEAQSSAKVAELFRKWLKG